MPSFKTFLSLFLLVLAFSSCGSLKGGYDLAEVKHIGHSPYYSVQQVEGNRTQHPRPVLDLEITKEVEYSINYFLTKDPKYLAIAEHNRKKYEPKISQIFVQHNLPVELLQAAAIESMFINKSRSHYGAVGIWQFMPKTAKHCGLRVNLLVDERKDPYLATEAAACYLLELHKQFGDWRWTLAAYNYGPYRIKQFRKKYPYLDFWQIARLKSFPSQTKAYVSRIYAAAILARQKVSPKFYSSSESARIIAMIRRFYPFV